MGAKSKYIESAKELKSYLSNAEYRSMPLEKAFIKWVLLAKYGISAGSSIVDGAKDGGIDAIFKLDSTWFVIQSKYETQPRLSIVSRNEIGAFEEIARKLSARDAEVDFDSWLKTVRPQLHEQYRSIRREALRKSSSVRFIFVTTKRFTLEQGEGVEVEDIQHISALWDLHSKGFTPPVESITLTFEHEWEIPINGGYKTHVGLAETQDFMKLMENDKNERLFAQNVRTDLHSVINKGIQKTYLEEPDLFWLYNNGLYIVCTHIDYVGGKKLRLKYPSIINGSQTLHSIRHARSHRPCKILVRILVLDNAKSPKLLSSVIRRTNTQNPMKLINLSAQDPFQLNIARYLDRYHVFYERREKEWANEKRIMLPDYLAISVKDVAQWLSVLHSQIGFGLARTSVSELFQPEYYNRIFTNFDAHYSSDSYRGLATVVWAGLFVKHVLKYFPSKNASFAKMSHLLLIRATYDAIVADRQLQDKTLIMLEHHQVGARNIPLAVRRFYSNSVKIFVQLQRKAQRKDPQLDYSNYFKRNELTAEAFRKAFGNSILKKMTKQFSKSIDEIV